MLILLVPGEKGFVEMDGSQRPADKHGAQKSNVSDSLENNARSAGNNVAGLIGEFMCCGLHFLQLLRSRRTADAVCPAAHALTLPWPGLALSDMESLLSPSIDNLHCRSTHVNFSGSGAINSEIAYRFVWLDRRCDR